VSSPDFAGQTVKACLDIIHTDIVDVWNLRDPDMVCLLFLRLYFFAEGDCQYLSSVGFKAQIYHLVEDLAEPLTSASSR
jgi:hypothetical protein